ncbi:MAG: alkane 1-monooxygenase [Proteobacteria bacterium]|nr:alkane 1-monooxygenase [Pseudomonadota bacterium]
MKTYLATTPDGAPIEYVDRKRWLWSLALVYPLLPMAGIGWHAMTGNEWWLALPLLLAYLVSPIIDWAIGEDGNNPPEEVVSQLEQDRYYRRLTFAAVPLHFISFISAAVYAGTQQLSPGGWIALAIAAGLTSGLAINTAHELGHKNSRLEKWLAKITLAVPSYGHFTIDHNLGHHRNVSTPDDPASARMGESIYRFALREIPGALREAWSLEKDRLTRRGKSAWHPNNQILQSYALSVTLALALLAYLGWAVLPFILLHNLFAWWQLTSANYIEHYGLLRQADEHGRYERCEPHHSWNSNHIYSNLVLLHLERHSDHHAHPTRRFQSLRNYDALPTLPNGYFGVYLLAYIPKLWFRIMDKRLLALPHVQGDLDRINIDPAARPALFLRYGRAKMHEPTIAF